MRRSDAESVAIDCLLSWTTGDFATTRSLVHDTMIFVGPLATVHGGDEYVAGLAPLSAIVTEVKTRVTFVEGDDVCIIYDLVTNTPAGTIPTVGWYQIKQGKVSSLRVFFDPRPLVQA